MTVATFLRSMLPNASEAFYVRMALETSPRHLIVGDILHWKDLRGQINAATGKINSYRDIRKITTAEGRTVPSLGSLRNYLGSGGERRLEQASTELEEWFRRFGAVTTMFEEEHKDLLTREDWEAFDAQYRLYMGG